MSQSFFSLYLYFSVNLYEKIFLNITRTFCVTAIKHVEKFEITKKLADNLRKENRDFINQDFIYYFRNYLSKLVNLSFKTKSKFIF